MSKYILVLYGTVTGNAKACATRAAERLSSAGFSVAIKDIFDVQAGMLSDEGVLLLCVSTCGNGHPPKPAELLKDELTGGDKPNLSKLLFAVLALGDSSYENFCQCGKDFDLALEHCGAHRLVPRVDADAEFDTPCAAWIESVLAALAPSPDKTLIAEPYVA